MINTEKSFVTDGPLPFGPKTLPESMAEAMDSRAREISELYHRHEVSLLAEALGSIGISMIDLPLERLDELGDIEANIERQYAINEDDEGDYDG